MLTASSASRLYLDSAGAAAAGVYVEASMGVLGDYLPPSNRFKNVVHEFAALFELRNGYYPLQFAWDAMIAATVINDSIQRKGATPDQIRAGLDSASVVTIVKDGRLVPVYLFRRKP